MSSRFSPRWSRPASRKACRRPCDRYLEYWNLVFVQYDMDEAGNLTPLPKGSIDTGMGLERIAGITQGVTNVFETDLFAPLVAQGAELAGVKPGASPAVTRALRTMAEHARGAVVPHHGRRPARQRRPRLRAAAHHPPRRAAGGGHRRREAVPRHAHRRGRSSR